MIQNINDLSEKYNPDQNISTPLMTKYEYTKIMGIRQEQLERGAIATVDTNGMKNTKHICEKEIREKKIPFIVSRNLPNGKKEFWRISDMVIPFL